MAYMRLHQKIFFLLLVLLPTQLGFHTWPSWTIVLGRTIDYLSPTLYLTDLIIILLLLVWAVETYIYLPQSFQDLRRRAISRRFPLFLVGVGVVFVGTNIYMATNYFVALYAWIKVLEYGLLSWYIVQTNVSVSFLVFPLAVGILYSSLLGISQYVAQHSIGGPLWYVGERRFFIDTPGIARITLCNPLGASCILRLRSYATFPHPNVFGGYLALSLPLIFYTLIDRLSHHVVKYIAIREKIFYSITLIIGCIGLFLTFSRSAWIVTALVSILLWVQQRDWQKKYMVYLGTCIGVLVVAFMIAPIQDESYIVRQQLNAASIRIWTQAPYVGVGLGNFLVTLPTALVARQIYFLQPVHNIYLLLLSEIGGIGILFLCICIGLFLSTKYRTSRVVRQEQTHAFPLYYSICTILLLGLVDHYFFTLQQGQLLFTIMVSLWVVQKDRSLHT